MPLHEWQYTGEYPPQKSVTEEGIQEEKEPTQNVVTWVYEEGSFVPCGKFIEDKQYSIVTGYIERRLIVMMKRVSWFGSVNWIFMVQ